MAERPFAQIGLHAVRASQLRDIAAARSTTAAEQVGAWITADLIAGVVPDKTPGFEIDVDEVEVVLTVGDKCGHQIRLNREAVIVLAADLEILATGAEQRSSKTLAFDKETAVLRRVGRAVTIQFTSQLSTRLPSRTETKLTLTPDLVRDVVRQIRHEVAS